jgi:outer membrane immunogenic protein
MFVAQGALAADWTGFYIGANVGGVFGDVDITGVSEDTDYVNISPAFSPPAGVSAVDFSADGVLGGAQLGYNFQMSDWVFGLEIEGHGMDFDTATAINADGDILSVESEWGASATARLGFVLAANSLIYVKGGYATGNIKTGYLDTITTPNTTGFLETDEIHHGFIIGGGIEHAIGENVSVGLEYNYIDLGETDHSGTASGTGGGLVVYDVQAQLHTVSARLNYHFNPF